MDISILVDFYFIRASGVGRLYGNGDLAIVGGNTFAEIYHLAEITGGA